jgi:transcriptional regulator with PAS, ATPase and Fis domain
MMMITVSNDDVPHLSDPAGETRESDLELTGEAKSLKRMAREAVELVEKRAIVDALAKSGGNVTHTAKRLGISRATLQTKMKHYGLRTKPAA